MAITLHSDQYAFMVISVSVLLGTRNVSRKTCRENQNVVDNLFPFKIMLLVRYCGRT
jgi:hypothetical protein